MVSPDLLTRFLGSVIFFFNDTATTEIYTLSLHDALPISVTGQGTVVPTMGNQGWFEYGGRLGFRVQKGWIVDLFANGTLGPQPVGNTIHGGVGLRISY